MALFSPNMFLDLESVSSCGDSVMLISDNGELFKLDVGMYKQLTSFLREGNNVSDITDEEYEEAVSVLELLQEKGITEENEELLQEMKVIIEEYENGHTRPKENFFNVID